MKDFFAKNKFLIIIACCFIFLLGVTFAAFLFLDQNDNQKPVDNSSAFSSSKVQSDTSSKEESSTPSKIEEKLLALSTPQSSTITVTIPKITFAGSSDPKQPLLLNQSEVTRDENGNFAFEKDLAEGLNVFTFEHKGETKVYKITYRYVIIESCSPSKNTSLDAGTTFSVSAKARRGSSVTASFNGNTITLKQIDDANVSAVTSEFVSFSGEFTLPTRNETNLNLGAVTFNATLNDKTDTAKSGSITCKRDTVLDTMQYVAEVVAYSAETFDGNTTDDMSRPTNSYLPQGTVDYCDTRVVVDSKTGKSYYKLRCGKRIYIEKNDVPNGTVTVSKRYQDTLPDHNELSVKSFTQSGRHTVLTLKTDWKAPFTVELKNQSYTNPSIQDYTITEATYEYLEIKFCYATKFDGKINISNGNPLFKSYQLTSDGSNYILRLYLKEKGKFYGWDCEYDKNGNLVFYFLHPATVEYADNDYGTSLKGIKIFIDVGHGGRDQGASAYIPSGYSEANRNLELAKKIKKNLENLGATVKLSRTTDTEVSSDTRCRMLKDFKPDFAIAIHHDSSTSSQPHGHGTFYSTPFSFDAATLIDNRVSQTGIYNKMWPLRWHYFYLARMTTCPVVLVENGFMSNQFDYSHISDDKKNTRKANAITQGIVDYFNLFRVET